MRQFVTASRDASIYEGFSTVNAGLDEILDIGKIVQDLEYGAVRALIKFDLPSTLSPPDKVYLNLRLANAGNLKSTEVLSVLPVTGSWVQGTGYYYQREWNASDGVTWDWRTSGSSWIAAGGDTLTPTASVNLDTHPINDLRIDVTDIVTAMSSSTIPNHGFMVKLDDATEDDVNDAALIKVFSRQTHTIYQPLLEFCWATQSVETGSLSPLTSTLVEISPKNISPTYTKGEVRKLYFNVRDKYPKKAFDGLQRYRNMYYLPSDTQFEVRDAQSGLVVAPFDEYSTLDTDASGSFVTLDTTPLERYRFYNLRLKVSVDGEIVYTKPIRMKVI